MSAPSRRKPPLSITVITTLLCLLVLDNICSDLLHNAALSSLFPLSSFTPAASSSSLLFPSLLLPVSAFFLVRTNSTNIEAPSPYFVFGVTNFKVTGELVRGNPADGCEKMSINATGRVVWIEPYHCSIETKIRNCAAAGCLAAVSSSAYRIPGNEMWTQWDGPYSPSSLSQSDKAATADEHKLTVPFVHVGRDDADLIRNAIREREYYLATILDYSITNAGSSSGAMNTADSIIAGTKGIGSSTIGTSVDGSSSTLSSNPGKNVNSLSPVNLTGLDPAAIVNFHVYLSSSDSPNQWQEAFSSLYFTIFFQVMLGCLHVVVMLAALAKFKRYYIIKQTRPFYAKIPLVCLAFLVLSNLERALYCFIDPMGATHVVPRGYRRVMISISVPWTYASTLLLTFFWSEAISRRNTAVPPVPATPKLGKEEADGIEQIRDRAKSVDLLDTMTEEQGHAHPRRKQLAQSEEIELAPVRSSSGIAGQGRSSPDVALQQQILQADKHAQQIILAKTLLAQQKHKSVLTVNTMNGAVNRPTHTKQVFSPPKAKGRDKRLKQHLRGAGVENSIGLAGQYLNEPFKLHRSLEEEEEFEVEEYVERSGHQQFGMEDMDALRPASPVTPLARPVPSIVMASSSTNQQQLVQLMNAVHGIGEAVVVTPMASSPSPPLPSYLKSPLRINVPRSSSPIIPLSPPCPPAYPPQVPAPLPLMAQALLLSKMPLHLKSHPASDAPSESNSRASSRPSAPSNVMLPPHMIKPTHHKKDALYVHLSAGESECKEDKRLQAHRVLIKPANSPLNHATGSSSLVTPTLLSPTSGSAESGDKQAKKGVLAGASAFFHFMSSTKKPLATDPSNPESPAAAAAVVTHQFLVKYQFPFVLSALFLMVLDLSFSLLDSFYILDWQLLPVVEIIFAIIGVIVSSMYFYVSYRVLRRFQSEKERKIRNVEYNARQGLSLFAAAHGMAPPSNPASLQNSPISSPAAALNLEDESKEAYTALSYPMSRSPSATAGNSALMVLAEKDALKHASIIISDIERVHHDRMVRLSQFLIGSAIGLLLFLAVTLASPQLWHTQMQTTLDDPVTTISRDFLIFLALFIVGACQVCAF